MSHFGFFAPPYLGHLNPMAALAQTLVQRGHRATFFGQIDMAALVRPAQAFVALGRTTHPPGALARMTRHMESPRGLGLFRIMGDMASAATMLCREGGAACRANGIDAIVSDQFEPAGGLLAAHLDIPFVSVANALPINREPAVPPPFTDWAYDPSPNAIRRNRSGYRIADLMMGQLERTIAREAVRLGVAPRRRIDQCLSPVADLTQIVPGLDFPRHALPKSVSACGPLRGPEDAGDLDGLLGTRPLVFASLGTLQGGRATIFARIAAVCAALDLHLVIAHGGRLSQADIARLPGHPVVRAFVPQRALLRHAALAITNGGLNTVLDALAAGVPLIVIPIAFEQGAIGARLARAGAGLALPLRRLTAAQLETTVRLVLGTPAFANRARALAAEIARAGGVERAADIVETVVHGPVSGPAARLPATACEHVGA